MCGEGTPAITLGVMSFLESPCLRDQLWSPVQNTSLWLGWWVHQVISTDLLVDAFRAVQGPLHIFDATSAVNRGVASEEEMNGPEGNLGGFLRCVRRVTDDAPIELHERPLVGLALAGPGDVPPLPAGSEAAEHVRRVGAGITIADEDPEVTHVVVAEWGHSGRHEKPAVRWCWHVAHGPAPVLATYSPGEADQMMRSAAEDASRLIEQSGHVPAAHPDARLAVGSLADAFGLPGLPPGIAPRAAQLMARADYVAAIVDTARQSSPGSSLDPYLFPLLRAMRTARMTAVDYALRELLR